MFLCTKMGQFKLNSCKITTSTVISFNLFTATGSHQAANTETICDLCKPHHCGCGPV